MNKKEKLKIVFLRRGGISNSAPFNRFISIVKAAKLAEYNIEVLNIKPTLEVQNENFEKVDESQILYDGILFQNIFPPKEKKQNPVKKIHIRINERVYAFKALKRMLNNKLFRSVIYLNSTKLSDYIYFFILSLYFRCKIVLERSEYPKIIRKQNKFNIFFYRSFVLSWCYKLFDGMVIMTEPLINFYSRFTRKDCRIVKIPMSVDPERFSKYFEKTGNIIGYVGSLNSQKDGLDILIMAFNLIHQEFPDWRVHIVGNAVNQGEKRALQDLIKNFNLEQKVLLLGGKSREEIPSFLGSASLLILARPESKQAEGGFPTKLGEYLMSGNPVIVTSVGEISSYLENNKDAYIINPGDIEDLARSIKIVLNDPIKAEKIGKEGVKTAILNFDYRSHSKKLDVFFKSLLYCN